MASALNQLTTRARQWNVEIEHTCETIQSVLAFGVHHGNQVVLKQSKQRSDEWYAGEILRAFESDGMVRVIEFEHGAVLLERLDPGTELVELVRRGDDEVATEILAQVIQQLAHHNPPVGCASVFDWARGFDRYLSTGDTQISRSLVEEAGELYRKLATSQRETMLLHGDLHHYNVLFDSNRGWVAIDPKGVVGELEYEIGAILRNPVEQPDFFTLPAVIERRLRTLSESLQLDYRRALQWSFAQAVLSAIWDVEDGYPVSPNHHALRLADATSRLLAMQ